MVKKQPQKPLKPAEELFCQLYAGDTMHFNNATKAYITAYKVELPELSDPPTKAERIAYAKKEKSVRTLASRLLTKVDIRKRCDVVLQEQFNENVVDRETAYVIQQREDLSAKMRAVSEFNKVKKRVSEKVEHTGEIKMTWEE